VALVFYLVIRGGMMAGTEMDLSSVNPLGIMAVSALVGMFSDKAILKLNEVFLSLFKAADNRPDKLTGPKFVTTSLVKGTTTQPYKHQLNAKGGTPPYTWSFDGKLPESFKLDQSTGLLEGNPTQASDSTINLVLKDRFGRTTTVEFDLEVEAP
jgi:hypothetical protein